MQPRRPLHGQRWITLISANFRKLQALADAVSKSEELQKQYISIQIEIAKSTAEKLAKLSESVGTPFTAEEYLNSVVESSEEMSTEQLRSVAAGGGRELLDDIRESISAASFAPAERLNGYI